MKSSNNGFNEKTEYRKPEAMPYGSVLVVDDNLTDVHIMVEILKLFELKADSANSGLDAIRKVYDGNKYNVIIMDHIMPDLDGIETTRCLRYMGYNLPIVAFTACTISGQGSIFLANGFDDFVSKPVDIKKITCILNKYVRDKELPDVNKEAKKT